MTAYAARFPIPSRLLHWLMAAMILAMLFIGFGMVATVSKRYEILVSIHRPLGIAILILVVVRLVNSSPQSPARAARHAHARSTLCGQRLPHPALRLDGSHAVSRLGDAFG